MIVLDPEAVSTQRPCDPLARHARPRVDDRAAVLHAAETVHDGAQAILVVGYLLDVVVEVRADDARSHHLELAAERDCDLLGGGRGRGGRHAEHGRLADLGERAPDEEVVGSEVVPPHAHAVHLVDHDETDLDSPQHLDERSAP